MLNTEMKLSVFVNRVTVTTNSIVLPWPWGRPEWTVQRSKLELTRLKSKEIYFVLGLKTYSGLMSEPFLNLESQSIALC